MTGITKCAKGCDNKAVCYRWTARDSEYQSYADFKPNEQGGCMHMLWPLQLKEYEQQYAKELMGV